MKNYLIKTTILLTTLSVGIMFVWGFDLLPGSLVGIQETPKIIKLKQTHHNKKVVVLFKGFSTENNESIATFEVVNISDKSLKYDSYEEKGDLFHLLKFNGEEIPLFWCGTGLQEFELAPNDSIVMNKSAAFLFQDKFMEEGTFQVSFSIKVNGNEYEKFWSQEFRIPDEIKQQIKKERNRD